MMTKSPTETAARLEEIERQAAALITALLGRRPSPAGPGPETNARWPADRESARPLPEELRQ